MKNHIANIYWSKETKDLNLSNAYFKLLSVHRGGFLIDRIWFGGIPKYTDSVYSYTELMSIKDIFYVRKSKGSGWNTYKTFKGLMTRLHEETYQLKKTI